MAVLGLAGTQVMERVVITLEDTLGLAVVGCVAN